jgi:ribose transport system permease protein
MGGDVRPEMQNPDPGRTSTIPAVAPEPPPGGRRGSGLGSRLISVTMTSYATAALLVILVVVFWATLPDFRTERNWSGLLVTQAVTAAVALAALLPLIVGEFDLSLGYNLGFLAMVGAWLSGKHQSALAIIVVMIVSGAVVGLVNGILNVRAHIGSFIATLGVGTILSALTEGISGGNVLFSGIPAFITDVGQNKFAGVAIAVWCTIVVAIICHYGLAHTPMGRRLYAIGGSERVAYLAGVRTGRLKIVAFVLAGVLVGVGAVFQLGQAGAAQPGFGPDLLLPAYGAAFLGITAYRPGYYNVPGTVIAILLLAVGFDGLSLMGVPFWVQPLFNGAVLLVAVMLARAESRHLTSV